MVDVDLLLMSTLRREGVLCHTRPILTVGYSLDLDSGITLTWPLVKAILGGMSNPDALVKDWLFYCESGDFAPQKEQHNFAVLKGAYAVRERTVKRFRFENRSDKGLTEAQRKGFEESWQRALNHLVDYLQS